MLPGTENDLELGDLVLKDTHSWLVGLFINNTKQRIPFIFYLDVSN